MSFWVPHLGFTWLWHYVHSYPGATETLERKSLVLKMGLCCICAQGCSSAPNTPAGCFGPLTRQWWKHNVPSTTCPVRPCCPLEINIWRKKWWRFDVLRERNTHALPQRELNTSFAKQFAPGWDTTSCWVVWKTNNQKNKTKQTPKKIHPPKPFWLWSSVLSYINLQSEIRGNSKGYALKDPQAASSFRDAFLLMLAPQ